MAQYTKLQPNQLLTHFITISIILSIILLYSCVTVHYAQERCTSINELVVHPQIRSITHVIVQLKSTFITGNLLLYLMFLLYSFQDDYSLDCTFKKKVELCIFKASTGYKLVHTFVTLIVIVICSNGNLYQFAKSAKMKCC